MGAGCGDERASLEDSDARRCVTARAALALTTNRRTALAGLLLLVFLLSGCVTLKDPEASLEYSGDVVTRLEAGKPVGQRFVSRRPRLNGVQLWLRQVQAPVGDTPGQTAITVRLYHQPGAAQPLAEVALTSAQILGAFPLTVALPPQPDPAEQGYYIELTSEGVYDVFGRAEDAYPSGALYVQSVPQPADAAFRLSYDYDGWALTHDLGQALRYGWLAIPLMLALWLPGRLLLQWIETHLAIIDWGERTALSIGLSLAVIPVVVLWTGMIGLHWSRLLVWVMYGGLAGLWIGAAVRTRYRQRWFHRPRFQADWIDVCLVAIFLFTLALRLIMTRDMAAPAWVDSVHHSLITRLIMEQGAFPNSYTPFAEAQHANYHPGFHSVAAVFTWLSGLALPEAMIFIGQVMNALSVFFMYLFTTTFTRDRTAGLVAALLVGVFSPMPAYYVSWGRYTQLTGLVVLPVAMRLLQALVRTRRWEAMLLFQTALACAGLFLIHYRVVIFFAALLIAYGVAETIRLADKQPVWRSVPRFVSRAALAGGLAILMVWPWFVLVVQTMVAPQLAGAPREPQPLTNIAWGYLTPASGRAVLLLAYAGLAWSILRARWVGPLLALWVGLLFMSSNQGTIRMPTAGGINATSVEIMLFMPLTALGGSFVADVTRLAAGLLPRWVRPAFGSGLVAAAVWLSVLASRQLLPILNPTTLLFREADRTAMAWVQEHIPAGEPILINPFLWGYGVYAGQDGGYFLAPYAGRPSMPPPVLYSLGTPEYRAHMIELGKQTLEKAKDPPALHQLMQSYDIAYLYLGARGGAISPQAMRQSPFFELVYAADGVTIFKTR